MVLNEAIKTNTANDDLNDKKLKKYIKQLNEVLCAWGKVDKIKDRKIREIFDTRIEEIEEGLKGKKLYKIGNTFFKGKNYPTHPYWYNTLQSKNKFEIKFKPYELG